jgi:ribonuclease HI
MEIKVFTDGSSCIKSKKCGYGVYYPDGEFQNVSEKFTNKGTNQRAELYAIYSALNTIVNSNDEYKNINIYTDSKYSIGCVTNWLKNWKANNWKTSNGRDVLNQDIIKPIDELMTKCKGKIKFHHVRAHTGRDDENSKSNAIVDQLAKDGANKK